MAEALTDDELVTIVDSYKRKRLNRSSSQTTEDRHHRCVCCVLCMIMYTAGESYKIFIVVARL